MTDVDGGVSGETYQWYSKTGSAAAVAISGATSSTYELTSSEEGKTVSVVVSYSDDSGSGQTVTSSLTGVIAGSDSSLDLSADDKSVTSGEAILSDTFTLSDSDGSGDSFVTISNADSEGLGTYGRFTLALNGEWTYTLDTSDTAYGTLIASETPTEVFTIQTSEGVNQAFTITVTGVNDDGAISAITGTNAVGNILTAGAVTDVDGGVSGETYQWYSKTGSAAAVAISGATSSTYELTSSEEGKTVSVVVSYSDDSGSGQTVTSSLTGTITSSDTSLDLSADDKSVTSGEAILSDTFTLTDSDASGDSFVTISNTDSEGLGTYGRFTLVLNGEWTYTLDTSTTAYGTLIASETPTEVFTIQTSEGVNQAFTITVTGVNDDGAISAITGTNAVGNILTAGAVTDVDGGVSGETYQWYSKTGSAAAVAISGATSSTYELTSSEEGKTVSVVVSYSDDSGSGQTVTSSLTGTITSSDTSLDLSADDKSVTSGEAILSDTFTLTDSDASGDSFVTISNTDSEGLGTYGRFTLALNGEWTYTLDTSDTAYGTLIASETPTEVFTIQTSEGVNQAFTITVTGVNDDGAISAITGTNAVGNILTAGAVTDVDGGVSGETYQWYSKTGSAAAVAISGATSSTYELTSSEEGKTVSVVVSYSDDSGSGQTVTSSLTGVIAGSDSSLDLSADDKSVTSGEAILSDTFTLSDSDGSGDSFVTISNADSEGLGTYGRFTLALNGEWTYTLDTSDTAYGTLIASETPTEVFTIQTSEGVNQAFTITVTGVNDDGAISAITGTNAVGNILTAGAVTDVDGGVSGETYQWYSKTGSAAAVAISGATSSTYELTSSEEGKTVSVVVSYSDDSGSGQTVTSSLTGTITSSDTSLDLSADDKSVTSGEAILSDTFTLSDSDGSGDSFVTISNADSEGLGTYGRFTLALNGEWTYTLDTSDTDYGTLIASETATEVFTIETSEGVTQAFTITVYWS